MARVLCEILHCWRIASAEWSALPVRFSVARCGPFYKIRQSLISGDLHGDLLGLNCPFTHLVMLSVRKLIRSFGEKDLPTRNEGQVE